jgi:NMD protein affecting ribosome stability and mRNA decay
MEKYETSIPFELELNRCKKCELRFAIIAPWESEDGKDFVFQHYEFCPYCGERNPDMPEIK